VSQKELYNVIPNVTKMFTLKGIQIIHTMDSFMPLSGDVFVTFAT
jgi:hypothetical protein